MNEYPLGLVPDAPAHVQEVFKEIVALGVPKSYHMDALIVLTDVLENAIIPLDPDSINEAISRVCLAMVQGNMEEYNQMAKQLGEFIYRLKHGGARLQ